MYKIKENTNETYNALRHLQLKVSTFVRLFIITGVHHY